MKIHDNMFRDAGSTPKKSEKRKSPDLSKKMEDHLKWVKNEAKKLGEKRK